MSLIDWSDPDEMLGLLIEYIVDEARAEDDDADRADFLRSLSRDLEDLADREFVGVDQFADAICEIRGSQPAEFLNDEVIVHVDACVEELRRISSQTTPARGAGCATRPDA